MDPGNWATALAAGSQFGIRLLFVAVPSSLMAIVLQALSARLAFGAFAAQLAFARPDWAAAARGLFPSAEIATNPKMLYLALGILGATVMPHNLFLHSGVVQTRFIAPDFAARREAIRFALADSAIALIFAMTINGAILILAAAAFYAHGHMEVVEISDAYRLIAPLLGALLAAKLFAIALIACGLNSSLTATLAGQLIMDGFIRLRLSPAGRRLITRALTITPAVATALIAGETAVGRCWCCRRWP